MADLVSESLAQPTQLSDLAAERATLGAGLLNNEVLVEIVGLLKPADFFRRSHQLLWQGICEVWQTDGSVDTLTLSHWLAANGYEREVSELEIIDLVAAAMLPHTAPAHAAIVADLAFRRRLVQAAQQVATAAYDLTQKDLSQQVSGLLLGAVGGAQAGDPRPLGPGLERVIAKAEWLAEHPGHSLGVSVGMTLLDECTGGFGSGDLITLAARPGVGKTSMALSMAWNAAKAGLFTAYFSLEMGIDQLGQRLLAMASGIEQPRIKLGRITPDELSLLRETRDELAPLPLWVDDTPAITLLDLMAKCRRLASTQLLELVVIDYVQLMSAAAGRENRQQQLAAITRGIKQMARELGLPVVMLAQLNREADKEGEAQLRHLKESGSIEEDSDIVIFLENVKVQPVLASDPSKPAQGRALEVIVAKHRNGPTGRFPMWFDASRTLVCDLKLERIALNNDTDAPADTATSASGVQTSAPPARAPAPRNALRDSADALGLGRGFDWSEVDLSDDDADYTD